MRTEHQQRIDEFMVKAGQDVPAMPIMPGRDVRLLRARLILEETLETIKALGFAVFLQRNTDAMFAVDMSRVEFVGGEDADDLTLTEIVDGCCDLSVVTIGTLSALGIDDEPMLRLVDENNLAKFGPGHSIREDGKLVKPPGHKPPAIAAELARQGA